MKFSKLLFLLPFLFVLAACSQRKAIEPQTKIEKMPESPPIIQDGWQVIDMGKIAMQYPGDWNVDQSGLMGTKLILMSPMEGLDDNFRENVNLVVQDLSQQKMSLEQFTELSITQIKSLITDANIISSQRFTNNSLQFQKLVYTGKQGVFDLRFEQNYWVINDSAYILTFTSAIDKYEQYKLVGDKIMAGFIFK